MSTKSSRNLNVCKRARLQIFHNLYEMLVNFRDFICLKKAWNVPKILMQICLIFVTLVFTEICWDSWLFPKNLQTFVNGCAFVTDLSCLEMPEWEPFPVVSQGTKTYWSKEIIENYSTYHTIRENITEFWDRKTLDDLENQMEQNTIEFPILHYRIFIKMLCCRRLQHHYFTKRWI